MKFKSYSADKGQFTETIFPIHDGYKMACCDCGLVHTIVFEVMKVTYMEDGSFTAKPAKGPYRVAMKVKRNERSTAAMRREAKKRGQV